MYIFTACQKESDEKITARRPWSYYLLLIIYILEILYLCKAKKEGRGVYRLSFILCPTASFELIGPGFWNSLLLL